MAVTARFHGLRDRAVAINDRTFAEPVLLIRPSQEPIGIEAILRTAAQVSQSMAGGRGQAWLVDVTGASAVLFIDRAKYPDFDPKANDEIQAISRVGQPYYEIARVDERNAVRLICYLTESAS